MSIFVTCLFILVPFLTIPLIFLGMVVDKKNGGVYAFLLALSFAILAYNFKPNELQDLYKYYYLMENQYSVMPFSEYITIMFTNNKFLFIFICYIISKIGNYSLLQFFIVLITYFIVFYTILDYARIKKISTYKAIFMIIVFIGVFYFINFFSGLAQFFGIALGFLPFYLEYIKEKKGIRYKLLYLLPLFIHSSLIVIPILRLLMCFDFRKIRKYIYIALGILIIYPSMMFVLIKIFQNNIFLASLLSKASMYLVDNFKTWNFNYGKFAMILTAFYCIVYFITAKQMRKKIGDKFCDAIQIILLTLLAFIQYFDIFTRFSNLAILFMNIYILQYLNLNRKTNIAIYLGLIVLFVIGMTINVEVFLQNDFNNIFANIGMNIFYHLQ